MVMQNKNKLQEYIDIVQKVAKVEHRRIPSHMVDYEELVSIGILAIQVLIKNKTPEQLERYNSAYIATAVRWSIRNELRIRYKWYSLKHKSEDEYTEERTVVEYRFYRNMQVKDIAKQVGLSSSRVTRIVQASLNTVKEYLNAKGQYGY